MELSLSLGNWSAWAPTLRTYDEWCEWARSSAPLPTSSERAPVGFLPPAFRRRCTPVTRAALAVAFAALPPPLRSTTEMIFASRHGEAELTLDLLRSLAKDELLSPTDFGLSVHNAASGLFSIATENRQQITALAAGQNTLWSAFTELSLRAPAALVFADEPLPELFRTPDLFRDYEPSFPYFSLAMSALNESVDSDTHLPSAPVLHLTFTPSGRSTVQSNNSTVEHSSEALLSAHGGGRVTPEPEVRFLRWLFSGASSFECDTSTGRWTLSLSSEETNLRERFCEVPA